MLLSRSALKPYHRGKATYRTSPTKGIIKAVNIPVRQSRRMESPFSSLMSFTTTPSSSSSTLTIASDISDHDGMVVDMDALEQLAARKPTPLRLADMYKFASGRDVNQRIYNAQFLYKELPIRIAQRAVDLLTLPHGLNETAPIRNVAHIYLKYLETFQSIPPPTNQEQEDAFTDVLQSIVLDRRNIPMAIARGINSWRDERREDLDPTRLQDMEDALYRFFTARVGLRFLTEHHILSSPHRSQTSSLRNDHIAPDTKDLGCIQTNCDPIEQVRMVADKVKTQTMNHYGVCPEIQIVDSSAHQDKPAFTYVPHHLQYMLAELLKNSCRATVRHHLGGPLPPIRVVVVSGAEDVSIKIADKGGGVPRSTMKQIWKFAHSTADQEEGDSDFGTDEISGAHIRGFGLPLARIYARYFGGELTLKSMEGYGLDAYLYLPRLGEACENLPLSVKTSPGERDSTPLAVGASRRSFSSLSGRPDVPIAIVSRMSEQREEAQDESTRRILHLLRSRAL
jgi:pyruvate dehydrogenase kinase 2/3/4